MLHIFKFCRWRAPFLQTLPSWRTEPKHTSHCPPSPAAPTSSCTDKFVTSGEREKNGSQSVEATKSRTNTFTIFHRVVAQIPSWLLLHDPQKVAQLNKSTILIAPSPPLSPLIFFGRGRGGRRVQLYVVCPCYTPCMPVAPQTHSTPQKWSATTSAVGGVEPSAAQHLRSSKDRENALAAVQAMRVRLRPFLANTFWAILGQSIFRYRVLGPANFGQKPILANPILVLAKICFSGFTICASPKGGRGGKPRKSEGPAGWGSRTVGAPKGGGPTFSRFFFPSPAHNFLSFFSLLGVLPLNFVGF